MDTPTLRAFLKQRYGIRAKLYDTQKQYRTDMLAKWNVHSEQVSRMLEKLKEIARLYREMQSTALEIRREAISLCRLSETISGWRENPLLTPAIASTAEVCRVYRVTIEQEIFWLSG